MKNKILYSFVGVLVAFALITIWSQGVNAFKQLKNDLPLRLEVSSEKQTYVTGEMVKLNFELTNEGDKAIRLPYRPDVSTGYLDVWIAFDGQEFNRYNNTTWGRMERSGPTLQPGQSFKSQAAVLWNSKPDISHLRPDVAKGKIMTDYAFPKAGVYLVKAIASIPDANSDAILAKIESEPIQIVVNEPVGDDLKVWN